MSARQWPTNRGNHSDPTSGQTAGGTLGHLACQPDVGGKEGRKEHKGGEEGKEGIRSESSYVAMKG